MNIDEEKLNKLSKDYEDKVVATLDVMPLMIGDVGFAFKEGVRWAVKHKAEPLEQELEELKEQNCNRACMIEDDSF